MAGCSGRINVLRNVRHDQIAGHVEAARVGVHGAAHQLQQRGFAAAIFTGDADLLAAKQAEGGAGEQHARAAAYGDVGKIQQAESALSGARQDSLRLAQVWNIHHPASQCQGGHARIGGKQGHDRRRMRELGSTGQEALIDDGDLLGMDGELADKAIATGFQAGGCAVRRRLRISA